MIRTSLNFESIFSNKIVAGPTGPAITFECSAEFFRFFAMESYGLYLSATYPLLLYCVASGSLSGAFAVVTLVIFGRPYRRYNLT